MTVVKKLEWSGYNDEQGIPDRWDAEASSFGVFYSIEIQHDGYRVVFDHEAVGAVGVFGTLEAAKAAAQADYEARILSALEPSAPDMGNPITLTYTNYRGETSERTITPIRPWFGSTEWHPEPQWLLLAYDHDKSAERDFALKDFGRQEPSAARDLALEEAARWHESEAEGYEAEIGGTDVTGLLLAKEHRISAIAIRTLSSPGHANAGKVEGDGWMPIESAPKDGTVILVYREDAGVFTAHYVEEDAHLSSTMNPPEGDFYWFSTAGDDLTNDMPTHWRHLPLAPASEGTSNV